MIFRLKTSKRTQEIFEELEKRTNYKPYTLVKHAIAWSLMEKTPVGDYKSDSDGLDLNRQTITGDNDTYFKTRRRSRSWKCRRRSRMILSLRAMRQTRL